MFKQVMDAAKIANIEEIEWNTNTSKTTSFMIYEQKVDSFKISECKGIQVKGIYDGKMGSCQLEENSEDTTDFIIQSILDNAKIITSSDEVEIYAGDSEYPIIENTPNACLSVPIEEKIACMKSLETALLESDSRIMQVMNCAYQDIEAQSQIQNSKGIDISYENNFTVIMASILVGDGDDKKSAYEIQPLKSLAEFQLEDFVEKLRCKAIKQLHATQIPSGNYPVLIDKEPMASLLGALSGLFNGEDAYKGISLLKGKVDEQIFDQAITIVDHPLLKDGFNSAPFDGEGVACFHKSIVENGILKGYLHNLKSAKLMNVKSTGNGFGGISPSNFYIEAGSKNYDELISGMDKGVIITELNGLHAGLNAITTDFSLQAAGFYVENGKIIKPINLITIAGNFLAMMKEVSAVGSDLKFQLSGVGAPSILFPKLAISGE